MGDDIDLYKVEEILQKFPKEEASLIPVLQEVQGLFGYLPEETLTVIGRGLGVSMSRVYGVVTFYSQFYLTKRGRHIVRVCRGTACHVRGGKSVLNTVKDFLGVDDGETTAPARVASVAPGVIRLVIHEGRNRQVRRMCESIGHPVLRLVRTRIGPLSDRSLHPGAWRDLSSKEVRSLAESALRPKTEH